MMCRMHTRTTSIPVRKPFDFDLTLAFLSKFSPMAGEQRIGRGELAKSWIVSSKPVTVTMRAARDELVCTLASPEKIDDATEDAVRERVRSFVSADEDLGEFYEIASRDRAFAPVAKTLRGLHQPKFGSPFEAACWSVINQRVRLPHARRMKSALVTRFGARGSDAFPEARTVARATEREIATIIGHPRKARAVWSVAQAFANADEKWLHHAPIDDVTAFLEGIYGVGEFATGFICFRGLGRAISLPWSDSFVVAARKTYPRATRASLEQRAVTYGRFMGHWSLYLWATTFL